LHWRLPNSAGNLAEAEFGRIWEKWPNFEFAEAEAEIRCNPKILHDICPKDVRILHDICRKMPKFYIIFAKKIVSGIFLGGGGKYSSCPPSPMPMSVIVS